MLPDGVVSYSLFQFGGSICSLVKISAIIFMQSKIVIEKCSVGANAWLAQSSGIINCPESIGHYDAFGASMI